MTKIVHCKKEPYDVYVGRPSIWANPMSIREIKELFPNITEDEAREKAISWYRDYLRLRTDLVERAKKELKNKVLGCFCKPKPCHADILAEICNEDVLIFQKEKNGKEKRNAHKS